MDGRLAVCCPFVPRSTNLLRSTFLPRSTLSPDHFTAGMGSVHRDVLEHPLALIVQSSPSGDLCRPMMAVRSLIGAPLRQSSIAILVDTPHPSPLSPELTPQIRPAQTRKPPNHPKRPQKPSNPPQGMVAFNEYGKPEAGPVCKIF